MLGVSVYSDEVITEDGLEPVMNRLQAVPEPLGGWKIERGGRVVYIEVRAEDLQDMTETARAQAVELLGAEPRSCVSLMFVEQASDQAEFRMAKAVARAMADIWNVVLDDYVDPLVRMQASGAI